MVQTVLAVTASVEREHLSAAGGAIPRPPDDEPGERSQTRIVGVWRSKFWRRFFRAPPGLNSSSGALPPGGGSGLVAEAPSGLLDDDRATACRRRRYRLC